MENLTCSIKDNTALLDFSLRPDLSFDLVKRDLVIGGRQAVLYFVDGFIKDEVFEKILEYFFKITPEEIAAIPDMKTFAITKMPYVEAEWSYDAATTETTVLSGPAVLLVDGVKGALFIDTRTYPMRSISEPDKDKSLRGSRDGFVETLVMNTAMIRRRIRDPKLRMEYLQMSDGTKLDMAIAYIDGRADAKIVEKIKQKIKEAKVYGISMTQQAVTEIFVRGNFFNPYPRIKFTERPDYASASILDGKIVLVIDNSPGVMIFPVSIADFMREVDDYYFPPLTGSFIRILRILISLITVFLTPIMLYLINNPQYIPQSLAFINVREPVLLPMIAQFLLLEFAINGLRMASLNTPDSLSSSLGIIGGLLLSEFAITSQWLSAEAILYMSFVTIANFSQTSIEMGYAVQFNRIMLLILVQFLGLYGLVIGTVIMLLSLLLTKTVSGRGYLYPIVPFDFKAFKALFIRQKYE